MLPRIKNLFVRGKPNPTPADYWTCPQKTRFVTREDAKQKGRRIYKCNVCGYFHQASINKRKLK